LSALDRGVRVYGSSSIGALRAAETDVFGTVGVGKIYGWYATGALTADDEVALAHGDASTGYRPSSQPLVNIRATLANARGHDWISTEHVQLVIAAARSLYFPERTLPAIIEQAHSMGLPQRSGEEITKLFREHYVNQKRDDAVELLYRIKED